MILDDVTLDDITKPITRQRLLYLVLILCEILPVSTNSQSWKPWSSCSKSCDIGIRTRPSSTHYYKTETQYCNLQYCQDTWYTCISAGSCHIPYGRGRCKKYRCICSLGDQYNKYKCFPEFGNCTIRTNPKTAIGYRDPTLEYSYSSKLHELRSCTTNDNSNFEVHVIGIHGEQIQYTHEVNISARGPVNKPIVLILSSYETTRWEIHSLVNIYKVLYGGFSPLSKVVFGSGCPIPEPIQRRDYPYADGVDTGNGDTVKLLKIISNEFGPVTSFTGYVKLRNINMLSATRILLKVGGDPLAVISEDSGTSIPKNCLPVTTPPNLYPVTPAQDTASGLKVGEIAGIVVSVTALIVILTLVWLCCLSRVEKRALPSTDRVRDSGGIEITRLRRTEQSQENNVPWTSEQRIDNTVPMATNEHAESSDERDVDSGDESDESGDQDHPLSLNTGNMFSDLASPPPAYDTLQVETPPPSYQIVFAAIESIRSDTTPSS